MKIYKYKDLSFEGYHPHFLQIVLENSIWCSSPSPTQLNDEDEFKFELDYEPSEKTAHLLEQVVSQYRTSNHSPPSQSVASALENKRLKAMSEPIIRDVIQSCRDDIGITSFSVIQSDEHLWHEYGGKGNGVCIEINIPDSDVGKLYHRVHYVSERKFHVDYFLEACLFSDSVFEVYEKILLTKTKKWSDEEEIRFVGRRNSENFTINGYISDITFGPRVSQKTFDQLVAEITEHCSSNDIKILRL